MERKLPFLDGMQQVDDGTLMDAFQATDVIVSQVSSNKTPQTTTSIEQHATSQTMDCDKHFPTFCLSGESSDMKETSSNGLFGVESNCIGPPAGASQPFLSSFLRGYESFPQVKFKILQGVRWPFSFNANENDDCCVVLHAEGILELTESFGDSIFANFAAARQYPCVVVLGTAKSVHFAQYGATPASFDDLNATAVLDTANELLSVVFLGVVSDSSLLSRLKGILESIAESSFTECVLLVCNRPVGSPASTLVFGADASECNGTQGSLLLLSPTLMLNVDSKWLLIGPDMHDTKPPAPSFVCCFKPLCTPTSYVTESQVLQIHFIIGSWSLFVCRMTLSHDRVPSIQCTCVGTPSGTSLPFLSSPFSVDTSHFCR